MGYSSEPSGAPTSIQIRLLSSTSIRVTWQPPEFLEQNGPLEGYIFLLADVEQESHNEMEYRVPLNESTILLEGTVDSQQ